jgi:hypothetical protein
MMEVFMKRRLNTLWIVLAILFAVLSLAMVEFNLNPLLQAQEVYDFSKLGTRENPTRDLEEITNALMFIKENRVKTYTNVWVHNQWINTKIPDEVGSPYFAKDGVDIINTWDFINADGLLEKRLLIQTDREGNELQVVAYGEGISGNLSAIRNNDRTASTLDEFVPVRFQWGTGIVGMLNEMKNPQYTDIYGWVEETSAGQVLFLSGVMPAQTHPIYNTSLESYILTVGLFLDNGESAHLSIKNALTPAEFTVTQSEDNKVYEVLESAQLIESQHANVLEALRQEGKH